MINVLQLIFDQFDLLADTFKVQKVRKTVNEYYMTAAGLPDRELIGGEQERAKATSPSPNPDPSPNTNLLTLPLTLPLTLTLTLT